MSSRWSRWRPHLRAWTPGADAGVDEEIRFHFDERIAQLLAEGRSREDARAQAVAEFGDVSRVRANLRTIDRRIARRRQRSSWLSALASDLRYAARSLWRAPAFSIAAIGTLALGVGINSVIFGAIDAVLVRPLPYGAAGELVALWENGGEPGHRQRSSVSTASLKDIERQNTVFTGIAGFGLSPQNFTGGETPQRIWVERVTPNFFSVLDVAPTLGRGFLTEDGRPGNGRVAIVSDRFWRQLGADPSLLGTTIRLDDVPHQVVGILPAGFQAPNDFSRPEAAAAYVPLVIMPADLTPEAHGDHGLDAVARLKPGATITSAQSEIDRIFAWLAKAYPDTNANETATIAPLRDDVVRGVRTSLLVLLGAVGLLWMVACVNLANLLLVRAVGRQREVTIRVALGARRRHVIQLLVTHSALVAMLGCGAGLLLGGAFSRVLLRFAPAGIPRLDSMGLELRTFALLATLSLAAGILFGLFPAWRVSRPALSDALRSSERNLVSRSALRWRNALVVAEISLSLVLLTGSGLLLRSFVKLTGVDLGFATSRVLTMNINLPSARYGTAEARLRFFEDLARRVEAVPGVEAVGFANRFPMRGGWSGSIRVGDKQEVVEVDLQAVSPAYFSTLGIPLLKGRGFRNTDRTGFPAVAVVNGAFVRAYFGDRDPVGQQIGRNSTSPKVTIVGVVGDVRRAGKASKVEAELYYPAAQTDLYPVLLADFAVRTRNDPKMALPAIREAVLTIDSSQPVGNVRTLDEVVDASIARRRFEMVLIALFAAVALALTIVGIYGVVSYSVTQRIPEFGVRIALGAARADILGIVLRQAAVLTGIGLALGLSGSYLLSRALTTLLFETPPYDPATFAAVAALLTAVAFVSSYLPARRAAAVEPIDALRAE
jgi:putative ABC transport system permease protein